MGHSNTKMRLLANPEGAAAQSPLITPEWEPPKHRGDAHAGFVKRMRLRRGSGGHVR
jgi:hypothetical protein